MKKLSSQFGFTITELIVAASITSLLFIGIMTFFVNSMAGNAMRQTKSDLLREAQLSLDVITKDIRLSGNVEAANTITDSNSPDAETTFGRGWESNQNTLILSRSAEDNNRNILFIDSTRYVTEKDNIVYFVENSKLYKRTIAAEVESNRHKTSCPAGQATNECPADVELAKNIQSFSLKYFDGMNNEVPPEQARSVEVKLVLSAKKFGKDIAAEYTTRTVFRNE